MCHGQSAVDLLAPATVGVSFGGLQAVHVAVSLPDLASRLVLHCCAPSTLPYPDTTLEGVTGPLAFASWVQRCSWRAVRALTASDNGLRLMMSGLTTEPSASWWETWTPADRASARETFAAMGSGSGFVTDLLQRVSARRPPVRRFCDLFRARRWWPHPARMGE